MPGFLEVFGNRDPSTPMGYNISPLRQQLFGTLLVLGNILSSAFSGASLFIPVIFMLGGVFIVPESPRWLLLQNKENKARKSLKALKPKSESEENISIELSYMKAAIDEEKRLARGVAFMDVFRHPVDRRRALLVIGTALLNPITGITWHGTYGTYMFQMANIKKPFEQSVGLAASSLGFSILNTLFITRMGYRRRWLVTGLFICAVCNVVMAAAYTASPGSRASGIVTITMFHVFNIGYIGMVLTFSRLTCGELPSQRLRALTLGFAFGVASFGEWVCSFIAPYFLNPDALGWNAKFAYLFAPGCVLGAIWVYFYVPEVKDRRLEEIDEMFLARLPARKFSKYECTGIGALMAENESNTSIGNVTEKKDEMTVITRALSNPA
ncbi:hypothetical protein INS49_012449 [Diaporthe citri]|uniref:uncharacterized protein n=1 Tax=Diaporthe citri TaxID=83186 RepID=UPI001C8033C9|nr:uncharacterized protein INS49_012449 [Diaporthe citri]KAG6358929.1 hypothetical protein INS49_012449 [Diaporthe citri]